MSFLKKLFITLSLLCITLFSVPAFAAPWDEIVDDLKVRVGDGDIEVRWESHSALESFAGNFNSFFYDKIDTGDDLLNTTIGIAYWIKNFFIIIAVAFLVIGIMKLLFSDGNSDDIHKWRNNIVWVSIGVFVMQIAFWVWQTFFFVDPSESEINAKLGWKVWTNVIQPIVQLLQFFASFAFIAIMIVAFYMIISGSGDEEKLKKWRNLVLYGVVGFFLIRIPYTVISMIYSKLPECKQAELNFFSNAGSACTSWGKADLEGVVGFIAKIFGYVNTFLMVVWVLLAIYAGWLVLSSQGEEENLKKAKNTFIGIFIGIVVLVASNAIFAFFINGGK